MRRRLAIAAACATAAALGVTGDAVAEDTAIPLFTGWQILPGPVPAGELDLPGGEYVLKQRLVPLGLAGLDAGIQSPEQKLSLASGIQLVMVGDGKTPVYCDATRYKKKANETPLACLIDADRDGRFEGYFKGLSYSSAIISLQGRLKLKNVKPIAPVAYHVIDPRRFDQDLFVGIQRRNYFNIYSRESFMITYGSDAQKEEITQPVSFKSAEMPKEMTVLGARFTALSETAGRMKIKVHSAMPAQPFAIFQTTTYRFY